MTDANAREAREERLRYRLDIAIAILLGIAAVATAWSAYQSSLWGGEESEAFAEAGVKTTEAALQADQAGQYWAIGNQTASEDQQLFLEYVKAVQVDDLDLAIYMRETLMTPELVSAMEWWEEQPDDGPQTPFVEENPNWVIEAYSSAEELEAEAAVLLDEAGAANAKASGVGGNGDDYDLTTVLFASSLFLVGIAGVFREFPLKVGMSTIGMIALVVGLVIVAGLERA